jgi:CPA1 family monovalent cation:H+ antiporter
MRYVYFISAGLVEAHVAGVDELYGAGDLLGAQEALQRWRCVGNVRAVQFGHFMAIKASRFRRLVDDYPVVMQNIETILRKREAGERPTSLLPRRKIAAMDEDGLAARALLAPEGDVLALMPPEKPDAGTSDDKEAGKA